MNNAIAFATGHIHQAVELIIQHPSWLIPAIIILCILIKTLFTAVKNVVLIAIVIVLSALLAGADLSGVLNQTTTRIDAFQHSITNH